MGNHWYKTKRVDSRKRHALHSLGAGSVFFVILFVWTKIFSTPLCIVKNLFGVSCFGCGMTSGFIAVLKLDFKAAYEYNVLSIPVFIGIAFYAVFLLIDIIFDTDYTVAVEKQLTKKYMYGLYGIILITAVVLNDGC